jgi:uncharacterized SAM-binding protein YcdF (DUF218 family)
MPYQHTPELELSPSQLLVLGRGMSPEGEPSRLTAERAEAAAFYYAAHGGEIERVVFSGNGSSLRADGREVPSEAEAMARVAEEAGLPSSAIRLEEESKTTVQNILFSSQLLGPNSIIGIVAHERQMPRALRVGGVILGKVVPVLAEDYGGHSEEGGALAEAINRAKQEVIFWGAGGDIDVIARREAALQRVQGGLKPMIRAVTRSSAAYN